MGAKENRAEILATLRHDLLGRLSVAGWTPRGDWKGSDADLDGPGDLAQLSLVLHDDDFRAIALFAWEPEGESALQASAGVVIEYAPARELLARLTGSEVIGAAPMDAYAESRIASIAEVATAARALSDHACEASALQALADVDRVLGALRQGRAVAFDGDLADIDGMDLAHREHAEAQLIAAILAGAGRGEEARETLQACVGPASGQGWSPGEYRRFRRQLTRVLDAGGAPRLPSSPPFWPPEGQAQSSPPPTASQGRYETRLAPPDRAAYPILGSGHDRAAVALDQGIRGWLDAVWEQAPAAVGMRVVPVWLTAQHTPASGTPQGLDVHIGAEHVGSLNAEVARRLWPAMQAAAEREEDPFAYACLTTAPGEMPYRLEVPVPRLHARERQ